MFWDKTFMAKALGAAALSALLAGAASAASIVVRSTGPSARLYPAGKPLADTAQIVLKPGDTLVILDGRGTRTLSGPGTFGATSVASRSGVSTTAMRILSNQGASERRGGAVRGGAPTGESRSPNLWYVDVSHGGTVCVADPAAVKLWRPSTAEAADLKISGGGKDGTVEMAKGVNTGDWPAAVPVAEGTEYVLTAPGIAPATIKFALVQPPTDLESTASTLIAKGCNTQLDLLIASTAQQPGGG